MRHASILLLSSLVLASTPLAARAGDAVDPDAWLVTVRGKLIGSPLYPGARDLGVLAYPTLGIRRPGTPASFVSPDDNVSLALFDNGWLKAGPVGKFISARTASDYPELRGFRKVNWSLEAGGFVELWPTEHLRTRLEVRHGLNGYSGVVADLGADWVQPAGRWTFSGGPRLTLAGDHFMNTYFTVTPDAAALNGRVSAFRAQGGLEAAGVTGAVTYQWTPAWATTAFVRYDRLIGDAGRSPLATTLGSRDQVTLGAILAYTFSTKPPF